MTEIDQLRADLEVLERYTDDHIDIREAEKAVKLKIAALEAEAKDSWRDAKNRIEIWRAHGNSPCVVSYVGHLTAKVEAQRKQIDWLHAEYNNRGLQISELVAENDRLEKRVAELEAAEHDRLQDEEIEKIWQDQQDDEPGPLDRKSRDIVRRLAEPDNLSLSEMEAVIRDATILWNEMLKGAGDEQA